MGRSEENQALDRAGRMKDSGFEPLDLAFVDGLIEKAANLKKQNPDCDSKKSHSKEFSGSGI